ncbi:MAG: TonB-dependent receptor [Chthoniobacteraceae bacterium]
MKSRSLVLALSLCSLSASFAQTAQILEKQNIVTFSKPSAAWTAAEIGQQLAVNDRLRTGALSRALVRLTDNAMLRVNELTSVSILPPSGGAKGPGLDLVGGAAYFLSRERPEEIRVRTPSANGILRGTEFHLAVAGGKTTITMFEGEVDIGNGAGRVTARSGEQVEIEPGRAPRKTAMVEAKNIIQWCLYYPGVVQLEDLRLTGSENDALSRSLSAYRLGNLPGALRAFPGEGAVSSPSGRVYAAAIYLTAGQVRKAEGVLARVPRGTPGADALRVLIAAVNFTEVEASGTTASDALAKSYYEQSHARLESARESARKATELAPQSGYAWTRLAELEFSFGRVREALRALEKGRVLTPRSGHAASLGGFVLAAQNSIAAARQSFEEAIALDPSYGNAWLGRGLTRIRKGDADGGRQELQAAAALEPNRSLFRSYLGKAWSNAGDNPRAMRDLDRAIELDANDPTPWLYRALQNKQENRLNTAVRDLEKSVELNDNRRIFRSQFLLDQDKAVRGANLASIYQLNGMQDVAVREATRAVNADYASASAHLFLANSYNALRDPRRIVLRYETPFVSEMLLANLLSPVGGGPLSQYVSEQEYSKLFESDGMGVNSVTEYLSTGEFREIGSIYGTYGNFSFSFDTDYFYDTGRRPNSDTSRFGETYAKLKFQLTPWDVIFFQASVQNLRGGDTRQLYDDRSLSPTFRLDEEQEPGDLLVGLRHEWAPGVQTLALVGRLASEQTIRFDTSANVFAFDRLENIGGTTPLELRPGFGFLGTFPPYPLRETYDLDLEIGTGELQQIIALGPHTLVAGVRYQEGSFHVRSVLEDNALVRSDAFSDPAARDDFDGDFERLNVYLYDTFRVTRALTLIGGITFDRLTYPDHFRSPPLRDDSRQIQHWSPKAGVIFEPSRWLRLRGAYAEAISGVSLDESTRLEPTQLAGFNQGFRTLLNESLAGSVSAAQYKILGAAAESKLPTGTYLGVEWTSVKQEGDSRFGEFDAYFSDPVLLARGGPGSNQQLDYEERTLTTTLNQLVGLRWSFGAAYRVTWSEFQNVIPDFLGFPGAAIQHRDSELHQLDLAATWSHECGAFARADALWTKQENDGFPRPALQPRNTGEPGDDFWQINAFIGYRFPRNHGELSVGVLNLLDTDYQLEPLSPYAELPHERTLVVRCRLTF